MIQQKLNMLCRYRREPISATSINPSTYISTENLLPNKGGISTPSSIPKTGNVLRYYPGDTLVSNIRPYFKKIWYADRIGECSNDILVMRPKDCLSEFLYWVLCEDAFFNHVTATSKGTKMPRGDRSAIMNYRAPGFDTDTQRVIVSILAPLQMKIELNNRINDYLAA